MVARINYPEKFPEQAELFEKIKTKHDADGANSVLNTFFKENNIDLNKDADAKGIAVKKHEEFEKTSGIATDYTQDRDNIFATPWDNYTNGAQYLKAFYPDNVRELEKWSIPIDGTAEINYPPEFMNRAGLVQKFYEYHLSLKDQSPLLIFLANNNIDVEKELKSTADAIEFHKKMEQANKDAEQLKEQCDLLFSPVWKRVHRTGNYLKKTFPAEPKKLGEWGFTVDDSPRKPRERTRIIKPLGTRIFRGVKLGSILTNTGKTELTLYKGAGIKEEGAKLMPGENFKIEKGWSILTVQNHSATENGQVTATISFRN